MPRAKRSNSTNRPKDNRVATAIKVHAEVAELDRILAAFEEDHGRLLAGMVPGRQPSARNLLHYLALRSEDLRRLQDELSELGLSSLGRSEAHTQATVQAVRAVLRTLAGLDSSAPLPCTGPSFAEGRQLLSQNSDALLGPAPADRRVRIMVTMPSEAAEDPQLVEDLLAGGMNLMRINCAHDGEGPWLQMIQHLARAKKRLGRSCKVFMDLAGPKLRTGPIQQEAGILHWRPVRDAFGRPSAPARIWLHGGNSGDKVGADASLPVSRTWIEHLSAGTKIRFCDLRDRKRELRVVAVEPSGAWAEGLESCYVREGVELSAVTPSQKRPVVGRIQKLLPREQTIALARRDTLVLTRSSEAGRPAVRDAAGRIIEPARIGCTLDEAFLSAKPGERIWFDDGQIGGVIGQVGTDSLTLEVTDSARGTSKLAADKGINLPDTVLSIPAITEKDLSDLEFVAQHADGVSMSFVRRRDDVAQLNAALKRHRVRPEFGIIYKIETRAGFENLPEILLSAMGVRPIGVMIARGDLAIECGYERMAELQEEILWICEAAHVPAIWATQVLESLAKTGVPSRAEITDAAMGERAECVMLNKGPHVAEALRALDDIVRRMQGHQQKKSSRLRMLRLATLLEEKAAT